MSTPLRHRSPREVQGIAACMCVHGEQCSSVAPGHGLHLIQARLAAATPGDWTDALVSHSDPARGEVIVHTLDGASIALWNAQGAAVAAQPGTPISLHRRYHVLAVGQVRFNVAVL